MTYPHDHGTHGDARQDIGCLKALEMFYAYIDGEIDDPVDVADFEYHIAHCRGCWSRAELEGLLTDHLRAAASRQAPDALRKRLRSLFDNS